MSAVISTVYVQQTSYPKELSYCGAAMTDRLKMEDLVMGRKWFKGHLSPKQLSVLTFIG